MPISLATPSHSTTISNSPLSPSQPTTSSASTISTPMSTTTMSGLHPSATYYPMQVLYYPTPPLSPSIYLQAGQMQPGPVTLVLRGNCSSKHSISQNKVIHILGDNAQY